MQKIVSSERYSTVRLVSSFYARPLNFLIIIRFFKVSAVKDQSLVARSLFLATKYGHLVQLWPMGYEH